MANLNKDKQNHMPKFPPGWDGKFTGPAYQEGDSVAKSRRAWYDFLRAHAKVKQCPSQTWGGFDDNDKKR